MDQNLCSPLAVILIRHKTNVVGNRWMWRHCTLALTSNPGLRDMRQTNHGRMGIIFIGPLTNPINADTVSWNSVPTVLWLELGPRVSQPGCNEDSAPVSMCVCVCVCVCVYTFRHFLADRFPSSAGCQNQDTLHVHSDIDHHHRFTRASICSWSHRSKQSLISTHTDLSPDKVPKATWHWPWPIAQGRWLWVQTRPEAEDAASFQRCCDDVDGSRCPYVTGEQRQRWFDSFCGCRLDCIGQCIRDTSASTTNFVYMIST